MDQRETQRGVPEKFPSDQLRFDTQNPRFSPEARLGDAPDADVIRELVAHEDLGELLQSIAANGYIDIEPLIVMNIDGGNPVVLEGNRRLAAIRVLTRPELRADLEITIPEITDEVRETLKSVTVFPVATREDARDFIGFKHINGPHRWDAIAKARFAAEWYRREKDNNVTLQDIARKLGDRHDTVQRLVSGIFVLEQAEGHDIFHTQDRYNRRPFAFSHLYTALTRSGFRKYLGLPENWRNVAPEPNPVPDEHLDDLKQALQWLYGSAQDEIPPAITSQNPHVKWLSEVLDKPAARKILLATGNLANAYAKVHTPAIQFENALVNANQWAEDALGKVSAFDGKDVVLIEVAEQLDSKARIIHQTMKATAAARLGGGTPEE